MRSGSFTLVAVLTGCGAGADSWPEGRPQILLLNYLQQSPQDAYALQFGLEFRDTDGDLAQGSLHLSLNGEEAAVQPMMELFSAQTPPLPAETTEGELELLVRVKTAVDAGTELEIRFELEDGAGQRSNDPSVRLVAQMAGGGG